MPDPLIDNQGRIFDRISKFLRARDRNEIVIIAPHDQRRNFNLRQNLIGRFDPVIAANGEQCFAVPRGARQGDVALDQFICDEALIGIGILQT